MVIPLSFLRLACVFEIFSSVYAWLLVGSVAKFSLEKLQFSLRSLRGETKEALVSVWLMLA